MAADETRPTPAQILELIPQRPPFRFIDEILELSEAHCVGRFTFHPQEGFYAGHFPGNPITPGAILMETMAQTGIVALGIYLKCLEVGREELGQWTSILTDAEIELHDIVRPGERVTTRAEKVFYRRNKLRATMELFRDDGRLVSRLAASGLGVRRE
jgi:3-hydroxyacyl-[acyl-carrier-protein] dehydratase